MILRQLVEAVAQNHTGRLGCVPLSPVPEAKPIAQLDLSVSVQIEWFQAARADEFPARFEKNRKLPQPLLIETEPFCRESSAPPAGLCRPENNQGARNSCNPRL